MEAIEEPGRATSQFYAMVRAQVAAGYPFAHCSVQTLDACGSDRDRQLEIIKADAEAAGCDLILHAGAYYFVSRSVPLRPEYARIRG